MDECRLHVVWRSVVFEREIRAILGGFLGHVVCAHDVRAWESEVPEEVFADAEGDGYEVVVGVRRSGIPAAWSMCRRHSRHRERTSSPSAIYHPSAH